MAASSGAIRAGRAFVEIAGDDAQLQAVLKRSEARLRAWGQIVIGIGAAVGIALLGAVKQFAAIGGALGKLSSQTGASVSELSKLRYMTGQLGIDFEDVSGAVEELNIRLGEAIRDGAGPAHEALSQLGLDARELSQLPLTERLHKIGQALREIENPAQRGFLADEILGGDAFKIMPFLVQTKAGFEAAQKAAADFGLALTDADVAAARELNGALSTLWRVVERGTTLLGATLAPLLTQIVERGIAYVKVIADWIKNNREAAVTAAKLAAVTVGFGAGMLAGAAAIRVVIFAMSAYRAAAKAVATAQAIVLALSGPAGWAAIAAGIAIAAAATYGVAKGFDALEESADKAQAKVAAAQAAAEDSGDGAAGGGGSGRAGGGAGQPAIKPDDLLNKLNTLRQRIVELQQVGEDGYAGLPQVIAAETTKALDAVGESLAQVETQARSPVSKLRESLRELLRLKDESSGANAERAGQFAEQIKQEIAQVSGLSAEMTRLDAEIAKLEGRTSPLDKWVKAEVLPEQIQALSEKLRELNQAQAESDFQTMLGDMRQELDLLTGKIDETDVALERFRTAGVDTSKLEYYRELKKEIADTRTEQEKLAQAEEDAKRDAERIKESTRTPAEKFQTEMDRLKELREQGKLDPETFERATRDLLEERAGRLAEAGSSADKRSASVTGTFNARAAAGIAAQGPERQIADNTKKIAEIVQQQLDEMRNQEPNLFT